MGRNQQPRRPGVPTETITRRMIMRFFYQIPARLRPPTYGQWIRRELRQDERDEEIAVLAEIGR